MKKNEQEEERRREGKGRIYQTNQRPSLLNFLQRKLNEETKDEDEIRDIPLSLIKMFHCLTEIFYFILILIFK